MKPSGAWVVIAVFASAVVAGCGASAGLPPSSAHSSTGAPVTRGLGLHNATKGPKHLYVADSNGVERFPIANGVPSSPPDLTYAGVGTPIAIGASGDFYATSFPQIYPVTIAVFRKNSMKRMRTLDVSIKNCHTIFKCAQGPVSALLVDAQGHLFVGYSVTYCQRIQSVGIVCNTSFLVVVYPPNARGHAKPGSAITVGTCGGGVGVGCGGEIGGLALDSQGDLLVSLFRRFGSPSFGWTYYRYVYAYAPGGSKPVRTLTGSGVAFPNGLAADTSDELYVDNPATDLGYNPTGKAFIAAYPATADGNPPPDRKILVKNAQFGTGIAVSPLNLLYVPDPTNNVVYELRSDHQGAQKPISTLSVSGPQDVKLGP